MDKKKPVKILVCFGTRPEAIKMAPVIFELKKRNLAYKVCVSAQHRELLDQVLNFFEIVPDYDLNLMVADQSINYFSGKLFLSIDEVLFKEEPDLVLVHGDTSSSVIIALAAFNKRIRVGHVEAGLRTYNKEAPFPEEVNRQLTSRIADLHFAPTVGAADNLKREGISEDQIYITGNTVVDALEWAGGRLNRFEIDEELQSILFPSDPSERLILVTGHRRENFGAGLKSLCEALLELSDLEGVKIFYPVHPNPQVREPVYNFLSKRKNIHLISPVSYPTLLWLIKNAAVIISDSGGIQEEAPTFGKRVLVTREISERQEGVEAGFSVLVGTDKALIVKEALNILKKPPGLERKQNPYGDGKAAQKIVDILVNNKTSK